jgi:hypothetical protein
VPTYSQAKHLVGLLGSQLGQSQHHVRYFKESILKTDALFIRPENNLVSFNIILFFTRLPLRDVLIL